ncbi:MAG: thioesterase family protein [Bacteroides sp.]|nr:thioesterase family protein [Bacteroides sp.]MBQ8874032.1 thioesterase family protein [Bacteroides sp.]
METGLSFTSNLKVEKQHTALEMGSGDLEVLATPTMVALMENAAMKAVANDLSEEETTVGGMMNTTHIKPSAIGEEVSATAVLVEVEGKKLIFSVEAKDSKGNVIGQGTHIRFIVNRERFLSKL